MKQKDQEPETNRITKNQKKQENQEPERNRGTKNQKGEENQEAPWRTIPRPQQFK